MDSKIYYCNDLCEISEKWKQRLKDANVYYQSGYNDVEKSKNNIVFYFYNDFICQIAVIRRRMIFKFAQFPSEYVLMLENTPKKDIVSFLDGVIIELENCGVMWTKQTENQALFMEAPTKCLKVPYGSHVVDLTLDEETLWKNLHSKHRNCIRNAQKLGMQIVTGITDEIKKDFYRLDKITWDRSNKRSYTKDNLERLIKCDSDNVLIYLVIYNNEVQGGAAFYYNKEMSYYLYGASIDCPKTGAMNFLHWTSMMDMKKNGVKKYSFVGCRINEDKDSKQHTMQRFKQRFGGKLVVGVKFKCIMSPNAYSLYRMLYYAKNNHFKQCDLDIIDEELPKWE